MFRNCSCSASADLFRHDSIRWRPAARQARFPVFLCLRQDNDMNKNENIDNINKDNDIKKDDENIDIENISIKNQDND